MAGFFQNLINLQEDRANGSSDAYATTSNIPTVVQSVDTPITPVQNTETTSTINIQPAVQGFGSYLDGILPPDLAVACGAFSASMQQIKNISSIPVEKFAQVVTNLETTKGLNVNGTSVPTDTSLAQQGLNLIALGNGPFGTYTMSNFLGCMSGLPYLGINIREYIQELETATLYNIYNQLYLAVTWQQAGTISVDYTDDGLGNYTFSSLTLPANQGGGYGRNSTGAPVVSIAGATGSLVIGTDPTNLTTYGKVIGSTFIASGTTGSPTTTVSIPNPTTVYGSSDWSPGMNDAINYYIGLANAEILSIKNSQPAKAQKLITNWELTGTLLSIEQRAIATGLPIQVPLTDSSAREPTLAGYPTTQYSFVDSIPKYAEFTQPHMYSQTLEAISDLNTLGGRSLVAMLRQSRNQNRLTKLGVPLDNNISDTLTKTQESELVANGILPNSVPATSGITSLGDDIYVDTVPATLSTELGIPDPYGYYDPTTNEYINTNQTFDGNGDAIDTGQATEPGSFAGSRYQNLIGPDLSAIYASKNLLPSTYSVQEAIDEVIRCNCDCWDNI